MTKTTKPAKKSTKKPTVKAPVKRATKAAKLPTKRAAKAAPAKAAPPKRAHHRPTAEDRATMTNGVVGLAYANGPIARADVIAWLGVTPTIAASALRRAVKEGRLHKAGVTRLCRYATTLAAAKKASREAQRS